MSAVSTPLAPHARLLVALCALAVAAPAATLAAQAPVASGRVLDAATGRGLPDVEVRLAGPDTVAVRTDARGEWRVLRLRAGRYRLRAQHIGHAPAETRVDLADGAPVDRTLRLDPAPLALDQVVVTAARRAQRLADAVTTTELVTRADIERTGASDLAAVLTEQTGIVLQGGHPAGAGVMLQGIGSERVLVLLDGQPVAGRISGLFDLSRLPAAMVERVEVVKGPQSTLYGTDAMGGVVNVITRTPARGTIGAALQATAGTQARRDGTARLTAGRGALATSVDVSRRHVESTPGREEAAGALAVRADAAAKVRWAPDAARSAEASVLALDERQRWRDGALYGFGDNRQWSGRLSGAWQRGRHRLAPTVSASVFDHRSRSSVQPRPIAGDTGQRQLQRVYQAELLYNGRLGRVGALDVGTQLRRDETETERVPGGLRAITAIEPFAQLEVAPTASLAVVPGVRVTRSSQWGTHVTPRVALRQRVGSHLTLRASAGEGFRAPDFKELYMRFVNQGAGYAVNGNAALRPETSRNVTAGAEWAGARAFVRTQLYWNGFRDFIETRPVSGPGEPPVYEYGNVDDGSTRGVDLETGVTIAGVRAEAAYAALSTRDDATGRPLLGRPAYSARATLAGTLPLAVRASVTGLFTGRTPMERDAASGAVTSWRDGFLRTDVRLARRLPGGPDGVELVIGADNLLDRRPAEWAGYTGRHVYTALSWAITRTHP